MLADFSVDSLTGSTWCKQELLSRAHTSDNGVEATKVQSLICVEEQCLFEAGRISMKATEDWRY